MQNDANSGWVYHIGDAISGDVLLVDAENLRNAFTIYASNVFTELSSDGFNDSAAEMGTKYDCILVNAIDGRELNSSIISDYYNRLTDNGVLAIVSENPSSFKNIKNIKYLWWLLKKVIYPGSYRNKYKSTPFFKTIVNRFYMQLDNGKINQVFYNEGFKPLKNPFQLKQKIRKLLLGKFLYPIFSSTTLDVLEKNNLSHKTIITQTIEKVSKETGLVFTEVNRCLVIPYKVLFTVSTNNNERYIFLILRGARENVRANKELRMLNYLNENYPDLVPFISKPLVRGTYGCIEYIVYREIAGVIIDSIFSEFQIAEKAAFNKLLDIGRMSRATVKIENKMLHELTGEWFSELKESVNGTENFNLFLDDLYNSISEKIVGSSCAMVLFHGDYKIENIIFNPKQYSVNGVIDWDLTMESNFPCLDLLYFIFYNRRNKNNSSFAQEYEQVFLGSGFSDIENKMIFEYREFFNMSNDLFIIVCILFMIHHFSTRERSQGSEKWLMRNLKLMIDTI